MRKRLWQSCTQSRTFICMRTHSYRHKMKEGSTEIEGVGSFGKVVWWGWCYYGPAALEIQSGGCTSADPVPHTCQERSWIPFDCRFWHSWWVTSCFWQYSSFLVPIFLMSFSIFYEILSWFRFESSSGRDVKYPHLRFPFIRSRSSR